MPKSSRLFKTKEQLSKMSVKDLLHYKKYLKTTMKDVLDEAKAWNNAYMALRDELRESMEDLEWEAALTQIIREECDDSQYGSLLNIH